MIDDVHDARPIAEALVDSGLKVLEVTLRTDCALEAIKRMNLVPGAIVGAGTVTNKQQLDDCVAAGAEFIVSPGLTDKLADAARHEQIPFLPGIANSGDIMRGLDHGLKHFKFFPAEASGGISALKALAGPFGGIQFCPTGGITESSAPDWLALDPVLCVGGSWLVPKGETDYDAIRSRAEAASGLARTPD